MADPWVGEFSFLGNSPGINEELRRRIALQMLSSGKSRGFPKNIGEGLSAIGDSLGDIGIMRRLAAEEAASEKAGNDAVSRLSGPQAYAPPGDVPAEPAAAPAPATPPVPLFTAPEQPASMLRPELPTGLGGASAGGVGPEGMYTSPNRLGMPPAAPVQAAGADRWPQQSAALSGIETGGAKDPYAMLHAVTKSGDRAYGKYGIMGANIPGWTRDALGRSLTPQQFLADRDAQEATAKHRFQNYANKYGEEGAARAWFAGESGMKNLGATDLHGRLNVGTYGQDFMRRMGGPQAAASPRDLVAAQLVAQGQDPVEPPQQQATLGSPILPQGMNAAPPQQPIRAMPRQVAQADPGGVPRPRQVGPTPGQVKIMQEIQNTPIADRPAVARALEPYMKLEENKRQFEQNIINKEWEAATEVNKQLQVKRGDPDLAIKRQKAPLELKKLEAEAAELEAKAKAGRVPTVKSINGSDMQFDPATNSWIRPPGAGDTASIDITEAQSKDLSTYQRGRRALYNVGTGSELHNWVDWYAGGVPVIGNALSSSKFQTQYNAAREFASIALRKETGAGTTTSEVADVINRYIPKPGASKELIEQMRLAREAVLSATRDGLGKAAPLADRFDRKFAEEVKTVIDAKAKALKEGKPSDERDVVKTLPPVVISTKEEKDALPRGRRYRLATDPPDMVREKKKHDE